MKIELNSFIFWDRVNYKTRDITKSIYIKPL